MPYNYAAARQAGLSDEDIERYLNSQGRSLATEGQQQTQQGGGLADWLPLAGGIAGSFIPGAGTIIGGALGAGAGALLKGQLTGQGNPGEVLKEAALGGAGGVLGKGIGSVAGKALGKGGGTAGKIAGQATAKAGGKAIGMGVTEKLAAKTIASNFTIPPKLAPKLQIEDALGSMILDGIKIPNSIGGYQRIAQKITGDTGVITTAQRNATKLLGKTKTTINFEQPLTDARGFVGQKGALSADEKLDTLATLRNYFNNKGYPMPGHISADDALDIANQLDKEGYNLLHKGINELSPNAMLEAKGETFIGVAEDLRSQINQAIDNQGLFSKVRDQAAQSLEEISPQLANKVRQTTNMSELRSVAGPYVRINKAAQSTINRQQTPFVGGSLNLGTRAGGAAAGFGLGGVPGAVAGAALAPAAQGALQAAQPAITGLAARGALTAGRLAGGAALPQGAGQAISQGIGQTAVRGGFPSPEGGMPGMEQGVSGEMDQGIPGQMPSTDAQLTGSQGQDNVQLPDDQQLRLMFAQAILQNPKQSAAIQAAYKLIAGDKEDKSKISATTKDRIASLKTAEKAVSDALKASKKGYGPISGGLSKKSLESFGGTGVPKEIIQANTRYQLLRQSVVRALQGARMSDTDIQLAVQYIPQISDTAETANEKLLILKDFLKETTNYLNETPESGSDIPLPQDYSGLTGVQ